MGSYKMPFMKVEDSEVSMEMSSGSRAEMIVLSEELEPFLLKGSVSSSSRRSWRLGLPVG